VKSKAGIGEHISLPTDGEDDPPSHLWRTTCERPNVNQLDNDNAENANKQIRN